MKRCDWGWQGEAKKLRLRAEYLLTNIVNLPIPTDITLEFDKDGSMETMSAHKIFLAIGSEVFMAMFYGPAADATQTTVLIPNYSKTVFEALVHYLYSDRIPDKFSEMEDDGSWMKLLESALQYGVPELATKCRIAIDDRLALRSDASHVGVCRILVEARRLDETDIEQMALRELDPRPIEILSKLPDISRVLLTEILQRSELNVGDDREVKLYDAVRQWAIGTGDGEKSIPEASSEAGEDRIVKKRRGWQLDPIFQHIRFPLMSPSQLADGPIMDGIFTSAEAQQFLSGNAPPLPPDLHFSSSPREFKFKIDVGELTFQYKPKFVVGVEADEMQWTGMVYFHVIPDWETCPHTSRRFIDLCKKGYQFAVVAQSHTVAGHSHQATFDAYPTPAIRKLFLPLPTSENSLMHDSGGTVSLCLAKNDEGKGSHYKLFISPDKEQKNTGTVFGRLADPVECLSLLKIIAKLENVMSGCGVRVATNYRRVGP